MSKSARWALLVSAVAVLGASLVLAFVLVLSTSGVLAERHFVWLFWVNVAVAVALCVTLRLLTVTLEMPRSVTTPTTITSLIPTKFWALRMQMVISQFLQPALPS